MSKVLEIECQSKGYWGQYWNQDFPVSIEARATACYEVPNAPVTIYVLTNDHCNAVRLLRLAADKLEREGQELIALTEVPDVAHSDVSPF